MMTVLIQESIPLIGRTHVGISVTRVTICGILRTIKEILPLHSLKVKTNTAIGIGVGALLEYRVVNIPAFRIVRIAISTVAIVCSRQPASTRRIGKATCIYIGTLHLAHVEIADAIDRQKRAVQCKPIKRPGSIRYMTVHAYRRQTGLKFHRHWWFD